MAVNELALSTFLVAEPTK